MLAILSLVLLGFIASIFGSIVGLGGGIIIVPALMLLGSHLAGTGIGHGAASGTSLAVLSVTALASTLSYAKEKRVDFRSGWVLFMTSGPAAMLGAAITRYLPDNIFQLIFGIFMLLLTGLLFMRNFLKPIDKKWPIERTYMDKNGSVYTYGFSILPVLIAGFCVGLISGLFGIGGGSLFVPLMVLLFRFPPHVAAATSMFVIFLSSLLGTGVHAVLGEIQLWIFLALVPGAWFGGKLGVIIARRMTGNGLLWILRITLILLSIELITEALIRF